MVWLDPDLLDLLPKAESDPECAAELLRIAARYLREGKPLPMGLDTYLADAFESAMYKPPKHRAKALLLELNLTALSRRPAAYWLEVGEWMEAEMYDGTDQLCSQSEAATRASVEFGISETTAISYFKRAVEYHVALGREQTEWFIEMKKHQLEEEAREQAEFNLGVRAKSP